CSSSRARWSSNGASNGPHSGCRAGGPYPTAPDMTNGRHAGWDAPIQLRKEGEPTTPGGALDGRLDDWQDGPGLVDSVRRYRWMVAAITLVAAVAAYVWSSTQPVLYEGVVRLSPEISADENDPGRIVRTQAEFITSPEVLDRTLALEGNRMSRTELEQRLAVEPGRDANTISITVLDGTRIQAG